MSAPPPSDSGQSSASVRRTSPEHVHNLNPPVIIAIATRLSKQETVGLSSIKLKLDAISRKRSGFSCNYTGGQKRAPETGKRIFNLWLSKVPLGL